MNTFVRYAVVGWMVLWGAVAFGQFPNAGSESALGTPSSSPPEAVTPGRDLARLAGEVLTGAEAQAAQRLDDALLDLALESRVRKGQAFDVADHVIHNTVRYADVWFARDNKVIVGVTVFEGAKAIVEAMKALPGVEVLGVASTPGYTLISASVPADQLLGVAAIEGIRQVNATGAMRGTPQLLSQGSANNQAEDALEVVAMRRVFTATNGGGVDVGTLSDSANQRNGIAGDGLTGIDESQNTGDLPGDTRINIVQDYSGSDASDEGRAMMEHIYDIAPGVGVLGFGTAWSSESNFANNINQLATAGMDIINDDVVYFGEPVYQDGVIAQAVNTYVDGGGIYFALNHNFGNLSYEGVWNDADGDAFHEYSGTNPNEDEVLNFSLRGGGTARFGLQWAQRWGAATTDLSIEIWNDAITTRLANSTTNNIGGNPYDSVSYKNNTGSTQNYKVAVKRISGSAAGLTFKFICYDNGTGNVTFLEYAGNAAGTLTPHAGTPKAIAIGAAPWWTRDVAESYSGRGPHRRFFSAAGNPVGPFTYQKPDFMAVDGCNTTFFGRDIAQDTDTWPNFFGTSAATPNTAAVAALMLQAAGGPGTLNQEDVRRLMRMTAIDLGPAGHDITYGYGRVHALGAVTAARGPLSTEFTLYPNQFGNATYSQNLSSPTDIDRFEFAVDNSGATQIDVTSNHASMNPMVAVFKQESKDFVGLDYDNGPGTNARFNYSAQFWTLYTVEALSESDFSGPADFTLQVNGPSPGISGLTLNKYGDVSYNGNLFNNKDLDYFRVTAPNDLAGGLTVTCTPSGFDSIILLFNSAGTELARGNTTGTGAVDTLTYNTPVVGQEFVILVAPRNYVGGGDFVLNVNFTNIPGQPKTISTPASVSHVVRPNPVTGEYLYVIPTLNAGSTNVGLWVPDTSGIQISSAIFLDFLDQISGGFYNSSGNRLVAMGPSTGLSFSPTASANSRYFHRVHGVADYMFPIPPFFPGIFSQTTYRETPAPKDLISPMTLTRVGNVMRGQTIFYQISPVGDNDYFAIPIPGDSNGVMNLTLDVTSSLNGRMELYSDTGSLLLTADAAGSGGDESLSYNSAVPGSTYYVLVRGSGNAISMSDTTQLGSYTFLVEVELIPPTPTPSPSPTVSLTPTISATPSVSPTVSESPTASPTPTPSATPGCEDRRMAFSFEEPASGAPSTLNGGTHGDIMLSPGPAGGLATILVPHSKLIEYYDPRSPENPKIIYENVGLDGFDLVSFSRGRGDDTPLRVLWTSEIDFVTGEKSPLGAGVFVSHGDLLTNTGVIWPNNLFFDPFAPTDLKGEPIKGNFGLDGVDALMVPKDFDKLEPGVQKAFEFEIFFSFEEGRAALVDQFIINNGPDKGKTATHGDILHLPSITIYRTQAELLKYMTGEGNQHGLDALDLPSLEEMESGMVQMGEGGWLFSVEETEQLVDATHGDLLEEGASKPLALNWELTGDKKDQYGLDGLDVVCMKFEVLPSPTPSETPTASPTPSPSPSPSVSPSASPTPSNTPTLTPTPVCENPRILFSFEEPEAGAPPELNGGTHGDIMLAPARKGEPASVFVYHRDLIAAFDPRDPRNPKQPLENVGLDGFDVISFPSSLEDPTPLRVLWSSEINFVTGPQSVLGEGAFISHGDLLTNTGVVWPNAALVSPFDPRDEKGAPLQGNFGLDGIEAVINPKVFDRYYPDMYYEIDFDLFFSFEESDAGFVDSFVIGAGVDTGLVATHGDILLIPKIRLFKTQKELTNGMPQEGRQHGLDAMDLPELEVEETGEVSIGTTGWLFSVSEFETLLSASHGDLLEEATGIVARNYQLTGYQEHEYGLDGLDIVCFDEPPAPPSPTPSETPTLSPSPTPSPTPEPPCRDPRVVFSFEEPPPGMPATLNGGTHGDIMLSPGPAGGLATVLIPHFDLIKAFDPRDPQNPEVPLENVGVDGVDLITFPYSPQDPTPLRVFWSSERDFVTGPNAWGGGGLLVTHGDLLTNTGAVWPNSTLLTPFEPLSPTGQPLFGNFGLDAIDTHVTAELFDSFDPVLYQGISFELYFSFEEAAAGLVDEFLLGNGPDAGVMTSHGDVLYLPTAKLAPPHARLVEGMAAEKPQHGLDALDMPQLEKDETGAVDIGTNGWLFSVEETETLLNATHGDVLEEAVGIVAPNYKITGDRQFDYGLDALDVICYNPPELPSPTPSATPTETFEPTPTETETPTPTPSCPDVRTAFSFEEPRSGAPDTLNGGTHGDIMISPGPRDEFANVLVPHAELVRVFDPRDPQNPELPLENVGVDGFDLIWFPRAVQLPLRDLPPQVQIFWSSEIDFVTGPKSVLGGGHLIRHGDLLTNMGSVWPNNVLLAPFDPRDVTGGPLEGDFGLDGINVVMRPDEFNQLEPGFYSNLFFECYFSFEEANAGLADEFVIGAGPHQGQTATHGDILGHHSAKIVRSQGELIGNWPSEHSQNGLDAIDLPSFDEALETGPVEFGFGGWLFSVSEFEGLTSFTHGDLLEEGYGLLATNHQITGDKKNQYGLDGLDVVCFVEVVQPTPSPTPKPTESPTPTPSLTPSPTPSPTSTGVPPCWDSRVAFSFEEPPTGAPAMLNGGTHGDIMISSPPTGGLAAVLVSHADLIRAFDPRDPANPEERLTNVGLDAFDLITFPKASYDPTPLRVFWSSEVDFITGPQAWQQQPGLLVQHGDLLTNTGAIWPNKALLGPFHPKTAEGQEIEGNFGLDALDVRVFSHDFDVIAPGIHDNIEFPVFFSFEEGQAGLVDQFIIGAGPETGRIATHGDILCLPEIKILVTNADLTRDMPQTEGQHGLDAIDLPSDEENESGWAWVGYGGWLFSVEETELLTYATHGDLLEHAVGVVLINPQLTGDWDYQYGLDGLDVVCFDVPPEPTPSPSPTEPEITPTRTPVPTLTATASPTPTVTPKPTPVSPRDSDGDGYADWYEEDQKTDPYDPKSHPTLGDIDGDGKASVSDAIRLYRILTGLIAAGVPDCDVNCDGVTDVADAMILYRWALKMPGYETIPLCPEP